MRPQFSRLTAPRRLALPALLLALAAASAPAARADAIDKALYDKAPEVMKFLKDKDYKNVGVLRFKLQIGKGKTTYSGGVINGNMATRLENALLMETDPKNPNPIGIIRDASAAAAAKAPGKHWDLKSAKDRAGLFDYDYPLAWGDKTAKADAFLVGGVKLSEDMKTTTVFINYFDRKSDKDDEVCRLEVTTDRTILADAGKSYVLSRGLIKKRSAEIDPKTGVNKRGKSLDDLMNDNATDSAKTTGDGKASASGVSEYIDFKVFYGDEAQAVGDDPGDGELRLTAPQAGQNVSFRFKNKTQEKLGLLVYINGTSTCEFQRGEPDACRRWVLRPDGKEYPIRGYVDEKDKVFPIKVVDAGDAAIQNELAEKLGQIKIVVFRTGMNPPPKETSEVLVSSRGMDLRSAKSQKRPNPAPKPKNAVEARSLVFKSMGMEVPDWVRSTKVVKKGPNGYMVPDPNSSGNNDGGEEGLLNPTQVGAIVIRYNDKPAN
jgi:hypothetical protein